MTTSARPEFEQPNNGKFDFNERTGQIANPINLSSDPDYRKLLKNYQDAEFANCKEIVEQLEKRYPEHPELLKFKDDLQIKLTLETLAVTNKRDEKHKKIKVTFNLSIFAIIGTIIVMIVFFFSYYNLNAKAITEQLEKETAQLDALSDQTEQLLLIGQPQPAAKILESIRLINPEYGNLQELTSRTDDLLRLEAKYQTALNLIAENKSMEALVIFKEIEAEKPGMWDIGQQIGLIETANNIAKYIEEGNAAYLVEDWDQVISAYENVLILDPKVNDPLIKEQLLKGYLNKIISMLQNEYTSIEDVENAERYYRKATALIPQSKEFANERENLQEASSSLLELKFTQTAKAILEDNNQTLTSIAKAVSYMNKAAIIDPKNTTLQLDLKNAEYYQIAFQNFVEMKWAPAITNLNQIVSVNSNFANGNARLLLFEAYYALGNQYYSAGSYQDALINLEQAEILAWDDSNNLLKLFQVQVLLGDTYGKMYDYKNAVSYYQYALNAIQVLPRLTNHPAIAARLTEANNWASTEDYESAFTAFQDVLKDINAVYSMSEIEVSVGVCLALFANTNLSTVDAILEANDLPQNMVITVGRELLIPVIEK